jgi:EAL domain-containing protein (putative c-di-GMP-specific phosphodiesterase class I)
VRNLATSDGDRQFVAALAGLALDAGLEIVAEFVSNEETMRFLGEQSVEFA